ncbi:hypothetical protein EW093_04130 [Thiospirochaeta perfilievii]|uniref:Uncharacterized protein n=1 Tax=Thiospirochaeta perfilievii TaxID=252967 RepID=A0A5C1QAG9_9SPIO|nr:hypothetical protein [Thiospirochaeta perfilievii]QEN03919.1 hypothetical protein EW093_04130 [Thiospirochaeta perfilievii]
MDSFVKEYNMFGPWIFKLDNIWDIPSHFREYVNLENDLEFAIKLPINADRRDVKPGMVLYNRLIILDKNKMKILKERDGSISSYYIAYSEIISITNTTNLLKEVKI